MFARFLRGVKKRAGRAADHLEARRRIEAVRLSRTQAAALDLSNLQLTSVPRLPGNVTELNLAGNALVSTSDNSSSGLAQLGGACGWRDALGALACQRAGGRVPRIAAKLPLHRGPRQDSAHRHARVQRRAR